MKLSLIVPVLLLTGCSWLTPSHVQDVTDIVKCVLAHRTEDPASVAFECALSDVNQVVDIMSAYKTAAAADAAK